LSGFQGSVARYFACCFAARYSQVSSSIAIGTARTPPTCSPAAGVRSRRPVGAVSLIATRLHLAETAPSRPALRP
jgi:hypothetical protein